MAFSPAAKSKEELLKQFRRNEILDAARDVIGHQGVTEISMERIAQQAGVAKGTLYLYFENKDALLESALEYTYQEFMERCRSAADAATGCAAKIRAIASSIVASNAEQRAFGQALQERPELGPEGVSAFSERLREQIMPFVEFVAEIFQAGVRAGEFRAIDGMRAARLFLSLMRGLAFQQIRDPQPPDANQELDALLDIFFHGVSLGGTA
ncbi:MAG: TetR/AcrR family transcriptional regulator [Deltaproteobacteria bacterium]|nr:MAG: TetR/AcrR family transcriptional regulator [Deltaproteobacteria bacterium]